MCVVKSDLVYIKHAGKLTRAERSEVYNSLLGFAKRQQRTLGLEMISVDVDVYMKDGKEKRRKFSMRAVMHTGEGKYRASASSWSHLEAAREIEAILRKQAARRKGKSLSILHHIRGLLK